jgi:hypothetical protein
VVFVSGKVRIRKEAKGSESSDNMNMERGSSGSRGEGGEEPATREIN